MPTRGRYGRGYRLTFRGERHGYLTVQRDLTPREIRELDRDLRALSGSLIRGRSLEVELQAPLSRSLATALERATQEGELLTTVSVPPLVNGAQLSLSEHFTTPAENSWLKIVVR